MIAASKDTGCRFYVNLNQRFFPAHRALKRAVTDGTYGAPFLALAHLIGDEYAGMCNPEHWKGTWDKAGGGTLIDTGTHIVDLMLWWFGAPRRVSCQWGRLQVGARNKADDNVVVTLGYDHMLADIVVSYTVRTDLWREDKAVYFPEASLHLKMESETPLCIGRERQPPAPVSGVEAMPNWWPGTERASVNHFLDCLQGKAEPEFGPEAGREALALILTAYQAARENRTLCFDPRD
jgi:predicted dehydrogenase